MPGNEVGDRVHNFFAPDDLSQGQHHSQVVDGNWQVPGNNPWVGGQRHIGGPSSKSKNYNLQLADNERGHGSHALQVPYGLNFTQSTPRPDYSKTQSQSPQPNLNGYIHGHQVFQPRQNEANFLGVDTKSDQHSITSEGLPVYELQQGGGPEHHTKISVRSEASESPVSFDFFGGQQQMSSQQPMLQSLPRQLSGFNDMQLPQQQVMFKKMQELQRQQQLQQLEARQQNSINQFSAIAKQGSGNHSPAMINGASLTEASHYPWGTEPTAGNTNWLQRASPAMQGSSNRLAFSTEQGQAMHLMGLVPQQVDQSLYGVPISSTRGNQSQHSHIPIDKFSVQQTAPCNNSFPGNQCAEFSDQVTMHDRSLVSGQGFQGKNMIGHASGQSPSSVMNLGNLQQVNAPQRNTSMQEFHRRQELARSLETEHEKTVTQVVPPQTAVALDPTEEKILFGTDENIWDAFAGSINMNAGGCNPLDGTGFSNGFPSIQSGSWSALMQSAVAETSSNDVVPPEEWSGLNFQNTEFPMGRPSTYNNSGKQQTVFTDNNSQIASTLSTGSVRLSGDANMNNNYLDAPELQGSGHNFPYEHGERLQGNLSRISNSRSAEEGSKWLGRGPLGKPLAEASQICGNAAHSSEAEINAKSITGSWTPQRTMPSYDTGVEPYSKPNGWNVIESVPPSGHAALKIHEKNSLQHSQNNDQKGHIYEEMGHGGGTWKSDSLPSSNVELERAKSAMGSAEVNREDSNLNSDGVILNSGTMKARQETRQPLSSGQHLNYWRHVDSSEKCEGSDASRKSQHYLNKSPQVLESLVNTTDKEAVKAHEMENCEEKSDGYRSNFSRQIPSGGLRENIWSDASDSQTVSAGKQKAFSQGGRKTSGPRKFQYHPMGNLDEDVESSYGMKQSTTHTQAVTQQISQGSRSQNQGYFGQSRFLDHVPKNSVNLEKGHLPDLQGNTKGFNESPSRGIISGSVNEMSSPFDRSSGTCLPNKAAQSSQNMLELLHKVDQSGECSTAAHFSSSECNLSSEMPRADNSDGTVSHLQQNQSSATQGFGLQLAPPSQWLPVQSRAMSSQSHAQTGHIAPEIKGKGHTWWAPAAHVQSLPPSQETSQGEFENGKIDSPGHTHNEASQYNMQRNFSSALNSSFPYSRSQYQGQHMTSTSRQVTTNQSTDASIGSIASHPKRADDPCSRALTSQSATASLPDAASSIPHNNPASSVDASLPTVANYSSGVSVSQISTGEAVPISQSFITSGIPQQNAFSKMLPNIWTNVPAQQRVLGAQPHKTPLNLFQASQSKNNMEVSSSASQYLKDEDSRKGGNSGPEFVARSMYSPGFVCGEEQPVRDSPSQQVLSGNIDLAEKMSASQGKETMFKNLSEASPLNPASTQSDFESFGRSLKPNNFLHQNYSLLHQMRPMKSADIDPSDRDLKRSEGTHSGRGGQQVAPTAVQSDDHNPRVGDALVCADSVASGDPKILNFVGPVNNCERNASLQLGSVPSQDMLAFGRNDPHNYSQNSYTATARVENSQISPQMAPSWFNQFGTFKNGQMLSIYDARKTAAVKGFGQTFTLGKPSGSSHAHNSMEQVNVGADSSQARNTVQDLTGKPLMTEHLSSSQSLPPDVTGQHLVVERPKKRKSLAFEFVPWHKEVTQGSQSVQTISMAEVEWAKASNRLIDKVEDEVEMSEDGLLPMLRPKRRLILTTKLMQQLLRPPPAAFLSAEAGSNFETLTCLVARLALADACSLISLRESDSQGPLDCMNPMSSKHKSPERICDQHLSKVMGNFIDRARKLENDLLRLDKRSSILDLRVECQEIEKFSVINRFAKFHGRGQVDGAETASSSDAATNAPKPCPQRYVTAVSMPRNIPDRVQCLSL